MPSLRNYALDKSLVVLGVMLRAAILRTGASTDPCERLLAHTDLISHDWRRSESQSQDGARAVWVAIMPRDGAFEPS